jgi:hypothetical protein
MPQIHPPGHWTVAGFCQWAVLSVFSFALVLLAEENGRNFIEIHHLQTLWASAAGVMLNLPDLSFLVENRWFWAVLWASGGTAAGLWIVKAFPERRAGPGQQEQITARNYAEEWKFIQQF